MSSLTYDEAGWKLRNDSSSVVPTNFSIVAPDARWEDADGREMRGATIAAWIMHRDHAERILVCVQACRGMPIEALQAGELRTLLANTASMLRDMRAGFPESELVESPAALLQRLDRLGFVDTADLERLRDLCGRCEIRLEESTEDEERGRWGWTDGHNCTSVATFATESEAGLDALKVHFALDLAHLGPELSNLRNETAFLDYVAQLQDAAELRPGMGG